jgi:hypothetical protein
MSSKRQILLILFVTVLFSSNTYGYALSDISSQLAPTSSILRQEASLSGYVTDSFMNPINAALVRVYFHDTYEENYSNSLGYYHVTNIPLCYCLKNATCSKEGYHTEWVLLSISENTTYNFILTSLNQSCYPVFNGTMGTGGWYISCVNVSFVINGDIDTIFYRVDAGAWHQYVEPFQICADGMHIFYWYYTYHGNTSEILQTTLKIDRTNPELTLLSERISVNKIRIIADATDETSGINRVEFFVDDVLSYVDYTVPYEGLIVGIGIHHVKAVAFDNAGNSVSSTIITPCSQQSHSQYLRSFLSRLFFVQRFTQHTQFIGGDTLPLFR